MKEAPLAILRWPATFDAAQDLLIVSVDTPDTPIRDIARQLVRGVLREILGDVELVSVPGQALRIANDRSIGISVSHENGLSLLAVNFSGPVGIDLLRIPEGSDWPAQIPALALDYLGPTVAKEIREASPSTPRFAQAWTEHEARLKCLGMALEEWNPALAARLSPCQVQRLCLPDGYVGAVAIPFAN